MEVAVSSLTPAWTFPDPSGGGLWFNSTDVSANGQVMATGTFQFSRTADFGIYVHSRSGKLLLQDVWTQSDMGVFWTCLSADGRYAAGGGWLAASDAKGWVGQMKLWDLATGMPKVQQLTGSRVNHIAMTPRGEVVVASCSQVYDGSGQQLYVWRKAADGTFTPLPGFTESGLSALGSALSDDGQWLVTAFIGPTHLILFRIQNDGLHEVNRWSIPQALHAAGVESPEEDPRGYLMEHVRPLAGAPVEAMASYSGPYVKAVSMTPDGRRFAAAASGTNGVYLFDLERFVAQGTPLWQLAPTQLGLTTTSAVTLARDGSFLVAVGNASGKFKGLAYRVDDSNGTPALAWGVTPATFGANPANRLLDGAGRFMAFGSGQPQGSSLSPGQFFVLDAATGNVLAQMDTPVMNWPLQLSGDGTCAFGGSDTGNAYAFEGTGNWI